MQGSQIFVPLNSRLESNKEDKKKMRDMAHERLSEPGSGLGFQAMVPQPLTVFPLRSYHTKCICQLVLES